MSRRTRIQKERGGIYSGMIQEEGDKGTYMLGDFSSSTGTSEGGRGRGEEDYFLPPACLVCLCRGGVSGRPASIPP